MPRRPRTDRAADGKSARGPVTRLVEAAIIGFGSAVSLPSCVPTRGGTVPESDDQHSIRALVTEWLAANERGDGRPVLDFKRGS